MVQLVPPASIRSINLRMQLVTLTWSSQNREIRADAYHVHTHDSQRCDEPQKVYASANDLTRIRNLICPNLRNVNKNCACASRVRDFHQLHFLSLSNDRTLPLSRAPIACCSKSFKCSENFSRAREYARPFSALSIYEHLKYILQAPFCYVLKGSQSLFSTFSEKIVWFDVFSCQIYGIYCRQSPFSLLLGSPRNLQS